ncbi:MAG: hypothetical protein ACFBSC_20245 [Microcoleaceae cyanobacterium]
MRQFLRKRVPTPIYGLLLWMILGAVLRFAEIQSKPPWSDEWATLVYSLGNSFSQVPLDQLLTLDSLLEPLQLNPERSPADTLHFLLRDSTHPPVYFLLSHLWIQLFSPQAGLVSPAVARCLSAIFGILAIPLGFFLGQRFGQSKTTAQITAALIAVSPFGIYLSQEARHYTLAILWVMLSLGLLVDAIRSLEKNESLSWAKVGLWIGVNSVGFATHYFFGITLLAEALVILKWTLPDLGEGFNLRGFSEKYPNRRSPIFRIYLAFLGTFVGCVVWLPILVSLPDSRLTSWIYQDYSWLQLFQPLIQLILWHLSMVFLLPVEGTVPWIMVISIIATVVITIGLCLGSIQGWKLARQLPEIQLNLRVLTEFWLVCLGLLLGITYLTGADLTIAARFQFVYFPVVLFVLGILLTILWQHKTENSNRLKSLKIPGKTVVLLTLLVGFLGGLTVISDLGFRKFERSDQVAADILATYNQGQLPSEILIATVHKTNGQTAEAIGLAWQLHQLQLRTEKLNAEPLKVDFLLAHKAKAGIEATEKLDRILTEYPRPLDLWLVNFSAPIAVETQNCKADSEGKRKAAGYRYYRYQCLNL